MRGQLKLNEVIKVEHKYNRNGVLISIRKDTRACAQRKGHVTTQRECLFASPGKKPHQKPNLLAL